MSNNKFQPGEEIFDEVAGHGISSNRAIEDEGTEGHMPRVKGPVAPEDEDTEGHGITSGRALPDDEDGTEGHGLRVKV